MRIGIVAGEASGDILASELIKALKVHYPDAHFEGIAGPKMIAAGCHPLFPMDALSVMLIVEVFKRLFQLLTIRRRLLAHFLQNPPDVFIGVDAAAFNLPLEKKLRAKGIKVVHYNSPKVWAWRPGRIKTIAKAVDLMLTIFPFEEKIYQQHAIAVQFIGHPLADLIPMDSAKVDARKRLGVDPMAKVLALLPGSRSQEIHYLAETFIETAKHCLAEQADTVVIVPLIDAKRRQQFEQILAACHAPPVFRLLDGQSRDAMQAADVVLLASGTATLECMLLKRPMVVAYKLHHWSYQIIKMLVKCRFIALPNLLADAPIVPEFIQDQATPENLSDALLALLASPEEASASVAPFYEIHKQLKCKASEQAANAIAHLLQE